jgi:hypothetical protein
LAIADIDFTKGQVRLGRYRFALPKTRSARIAVGIALIIGGTLGFLPVLGFWMLPLGLIILSQDISAVRRWRRKLVVKWERRRNQKQDGRE